MFSKLKKQKRKKKVYFLFLIAFSSATETCFFFSNLSLKADFEN